MDTLTRKKSIMDKNMNKGIKIRNNKLKKKAIKRSTVKEEQKNLCRFITITYEVIERVNGKYKRTGSNKANGLQIENKVYLNDGGFKFVNSKSVHVKKCFDIIPNWVSEQLIEKYQRTIVEESKDKLSSKNENCIGV